MGAADGTRAAVGEALAAARDGLEAADGEQLALLELPTRFEGELAELQRGKVVSARRGRPPGARNRVTQDLRRYLAAHGFDPAHWLVAWAQHTPETLARELDCSLAEAWDRLYSLHRELMTYCYGRALPVDDVGRPAPVIAIAIGGEARLAGPAAPPWIYPGGPSIEHEQNQSVTAPSAPESHGAESHEARK